MNALNLTCQWLASELGTFINREVIVIVGDGCLEISASPKTENWIEVPKQEDIKRCKLRLPVITDDLLELKHVAANAMGFDIAP